MSPRRWASWLVSLAVVLVSTGVLLPSPARADGPVCTPPAQATFQPDGSYTCTVPGGGGGPGTPGTPGGGDGGGGGPATPTCQLYADYTYCRGVYACKPLPWDPTRYDLPPGEPPTPGATPEVYVCDLGGPDIQGPVAPVVQWPGEAPQPPSLAEQAQTAVGQIDLPLLTLRTSPAGRTVVNLPTWFWVEGAGVGGPETGSSAFGLVAIATLQQLEVDPGDGRGWQTCPLVASAEDAEESCSFTYDRASWTGSASHEGRPAHEAAVRSRWQLRFEVGGNPVTVPGAPTELTGPTATAVVRVDEVQSVVRSTG